MMTADFEQRLNQVLPRLLSTDVLDNRGAGGEIGFWIFDYPPEREMDMRLWLDDVIVPGIQKQRPELRYAVVDLFQEVIALLQERKLLDKAPGVGILLTSDGDEPPIDLAPFDGHVQYLRKPYLPRELMHRVQAASGCGGEAEPG